MILIFNITPSLKIGGAEGDRTPDLSIANAALSQLSYCPDMLSSFVKQSSCPKIKQLATIDKIELKTRSPLKHNVSFPI
jgi:hypothetical protein